ncbi:MAG TPA: phosphoribosylanthranilate isomerase [Fimbriimonadaceae bacterium]|nr:phosphoribosylanthranilate isomerase [Fimbriimonadaceae bacterium]
MSTKVKICGLTRAEDVEKAIDLGADALGFVFEPNSPRYIGSRANDLIGAVEPYVLCVGVYGQFHSADCPHLNAVQFTELGGTASIFSSVGMGRTPPVIKALRISGRDEPGLALKLAEDWLRQFRIEPRGLLLDAYDEAKHGGTGKRVDWDFAAEFVRLSSRPVILAGGLTPENVAEAVAKVRPYAVDVSGGVEASPGVKDHAKMRDFIQAARR